MRKSIIASNGYALAAEQIRPVMEWLDLVAIARIDMSSEDAGYPVEQAFLGTVASDASGGPQPRGWQAADLGPQTLRLRFDAPQTIKRVLLRFHDGAQERSQEFTLKATLAGGQTQEIVRQQWSFSPGGSTDELENYVVNLEDVTILTLWIDPDRGLNRYPATLEAFRVEG